jgi:hypothetical protein
MGVTGVTNSEEFLLNDLLKFIMQHWPRALNFSASNHSKWPAPGVVL